MPLPDGQLESVQLEPVQEDPPADLSGAPSLYLDYLVENRSTPARIDFELRIVNETAGEVVVRGNPYRGMTYTLSDDDGWPVQLATPAHPVKVDGPGGPADAARLQYLELVGARQDGVELGVEETLARTEWSLAPASTFTYQLAVTSMAERDDEDAVLPLVAGTYELGLIVPVSFAAGRHERDVILMSDEVTITVGG